MTYATLAHLTDRFGADMLIALTDRAQPATGAIDAVVVDRALADADAVIDGYIGGRYVLPLAEVPPLLADIARSIAIWKLHTHRPDDKIAEDYKDALRLLRDISDGKITLSVASQTAPATVEGSGARLTDRERPLTAENMVGFI